MSPPIHEEYAASENGLKMFEQRFAYLDVTRIELGTLVHVLQQSPGCANHNVASGHQLALLTHLVRRSAYDEARGEVVKTAHFAQFFESLKDKS